MTGLSVPDQFGARLGATTMLLEKQGIAVSLGGRFEGLPAIDLIGKSEGFRRPGYILSIEPGIFWVKKQHVLSLTVPYALIRNRTKNFTDRQDPAGLKHGDAAFADYLITASYAIRLGNKNTNAKPLNIPEWNK